MPWLGEAIGQDWAEESKVEILVGPKEGGLFGCQDEGMNVSFSSIAENQKEVKQLFCE